MRKINSGFRTGNISEEGHQLSNRDYFGYVEMDDLACYVMADSLDEESTVNSARIAVESVIRDFTEHPSVKKRALDNYLRRAHKELRQHRGGLRLKAAVVAVVTDYQSIRYCYAGNSRFYLIRNGRILEQSEDQSLTRNMAEEGRMPLDQAEAHEERNNLYSYLGERGTLQLRISKRIRLQDGDVFALLTRGIWERCGQQKFLACVNEGKELEEILGQIEDAVLETQEEQEVDNYSLALTFVDKTYQPPQKKWTLKKILMLFVPVLSTIAIMGITFYLRYRNIRSQEESLARCMESGEIYMRYDNYQKAAEEYGEAMNLANKLKRQEESVESDKYKKLAEQILLADSAMVSGEYQKAQGLYLTAADMSMEAGNIGRAYIYDQLERAKDYIEVFDLMEAGERKEEYGDLAGAVETYKEARYKAADLYYKEGKAEALEKQIAAEEKIESQEQKDRDRKKELEESAAAEVAKQQEEEAAKQDLENQQKANDQQNAIDLENKGNELMVQGRYESAITFYQTAQVIYIRLELPELADGLNAKIQAARAGIEAEKLEAQGEMPETALADPGETEKETVRENIPETEVEEQGGEYGPGMDIH